MATAAKKERVSLQTPIGIATFVHLWEPHAIKSKDPKAADKDPQYSIMVVFTEEEARAKLKEMRIACKRAAMDRFKLDKDELQKAITKGKMRMPWRDASDYEEYGEPFTVDDAVMCMFKSNTPPGIVDARAKVVTNREDIYSGMLCRVSYGVWPYENSGNKGVTLLLNNVQKAGKGTRLSGRADPTEEFDSIDGGDGDDDDDDDDDSPI